MMVMKTTPTSAARRASKKTVQKAGVVHFEGAKVLINETE
jgi:hypothetical protein